MFDLLLSVSIKKIEDRNPESNGPRTCTFYILISLPYTTLPHRHAKIPKNLST